MLSPMSATPHDIHVKRDPAAQLHGGSRSRTIEKRTKSQKPAKGHAKGTLSLPTLESRAKPSLLFCSVRALLGAWVRLQIPSRVATASSSPIAVNSRDAAFRRVPTATAGAKFGLVRPSGPNWVLLLSE